MSDQTSVDRDALPIPDYDHLPVTGLGHRIRSLSAEQIAALLTYEQAHGDRLPVVQVFQARLTELENGAEPSDGDASGLAPELAAGGAQGGSVVSPQTQGPTINPPSHGDPTNPAQPR